VFDVGAHVGESATTYANWFPDAAIHSFEPSSDAYSKLTSATCHLKNARSHQIAFGNTEGSAQLFIHPRGPRMNYISETPRVVDAGSHGQHSEEVQICKLDSYCERENFTTIEFVKIDTEGGDFEVLLGADNMLIQQRIDIIQVECGMNPNNKHHISFEVIKDHLERRSYFVLGLYEQFSEWPTREPNLRRVNAVFASKSVIQANRYE
jgi:FkbM family methyltransferase